MQDFKQLIATIEQAHQNLQAASANAVNQALTIRNWLIGYYIVAFEQNGADKATYGGRLIENTAKKLAHIKGIDKRALFRFRQFYLTYPHIATAIAKHGIFALLPQNPNQEKVGSLPPLFPIASIVGATPPLSDKGLAVPAKKLLSKLSYSHIELLLNIDDPLKRTFYEIECIKGTWSIRELKRQISILYYERSGLSAQPEKLAQMVQQQNSPKVATDIIKNIYAFELLDISTKTIVEESDLETALLDHLQQFIIELGYGFCMEARQKRILIGETYYFIDLVFYHRILKCHVLVDLKIGAFDHGDIGQLNAYINYYKQEVSENSDNPPVGIMLVAEKDHALVRYATAGMDENLFVQQYLIKLPAKEQLEQYIESKLKKIN